MATPLGLYEFLYLPFGLQNSPSSFTPMMLLLLRDITDITSYMDDICVHTTETVHHAYILRQVFCRIRMLGFTVKPSKTEIAFPEIQFLGHKISKGFLYTDSNIVTKILNISSLTTKKEVRTLRGLINYYQKFIRNFAGITAKLSEFLKKEQPDKIQWSEEHEKILQEITSLFSSPPILRIPDMSKDFVVQTDASSHTISAILLQEYNGLLHPVLYSSRKLNQTQRWYAITELEALSVVELVSLSS